MNKTVPPKDYEINAQGSLGILALGSVGIKKWREAVKLKESKKDKKSKDE